MANEKPFQFKQFSLAHSKSALKIGTDSILLGSWAETKNALNILDVGSGCGILSFMLAQKAPQAKILGIENEDDSFQESLFNLKGNPFKERVDFTLADFKDWTSDLRFDLIVSNPPYFEVAQTTGNPARDNARRQNSLSHELLLNNILLVLAEKATVNLILPPPEAQNFIALAQKKGLHLMRFCSVKSKEEALTKRCLISLSNYPSPLQEQEIILYQANGKRHHQFTEITADFYR
jgi:tRNA1Val (adenine37-N6)-methyltransferase